MSSIFDFIKNAGAKIGAILQSPFCMIASLLDFADNILDIGERIGRAIENVNSRRKKTKQICADVKEYDLARFFQEAEFDASKCESFKNFSNKKTNKQIKTFVDYYQNSVAFEKEIRGICAKGSLEDDEYEKYIKLFIRLFEEVSKKFDFDKLDEQGKVIYKLMMTNFSEISKEINKITIPDQNQEYVEELRENIKTIMLMLAQNPNVGWGKIVASKETLKYIVRECPECGYRGKYISYISDKEGEWCYCSACGTTYTAYKNDPELVEIVQNGVGKIVATITNGQELSDTKLQDIKEDIEKKLDELMTKKAFNTALNTAIEKLTQKLENTSEHSADELKARIDTQTEVFKALIKRVTDELGELEGTIAKTDDVAEKVKIIEEKLKSINFEAICETIDSISRDTHDIKETGEETNVIAKDTNGNIHQVKEISEETNVNTKEIKANTKEIKAGIEKINERLTLVEATIEENKKSGDTGKNQQALQPVNEMLAPESLTTAVVKDAQNEQNEAPESEWSLEKINKNYEAALENIDAIAGQVKKSLEEKSDADKFEKLYDGLGENNQKLFHCMLYMGGCTERNDENKLIYYKCEDDECLYAEGTDGKIKIEIAQFVSKDENEIRWLFMNWLSWTETQNAKTRAQMKVLANKLLELAIDKMKIECENKTVLVNNCKKCMRGEE